MKIGHSPPNMVDTVHVQRKIEKNKEKGITDLYLADHGDGDIRVLGSLTLEDADEAVNMKMLLRDSNNTSIWLPNSTPPDLPSVHREGFQLAGYFEVSRQSLHEVDSEASGLEDGGGEILCTYL